MVEQTSIPGTEPPADTTKPTGGNNPPRVAKPRKPRTPRATKPTYTGTYAGGSLVTYPQSRMVLNIGDAGFMQRLRVAWMLLRRKSVRIDGNHTLVVKAKAVPEVKPLAEVFNGAPDTDPGVRYVLD